MGDMTDDQLSMDDRVEASYSTPPLTAADALAKSGFTEYRKATLTPISDITFPPGTVYQTPEGLRAEDEETRCAFDVQGGIYPIRESVFQASYELATLDRDRAARDALSVEALAEAMKRVGVGSDDVYREDAAAAILAALPVSPSRADEDDR